MQNVGKKFGPHDVVRLDDGMLALLVRPNKPDEFPHSVTLNFSGAETALEFISPLKNTIRFAILQFGSGRTERILLSQALEFACRNTRGAFGIINESDLDTTWIDGDEEPPAVPAVSTTTSAISYTWEDVKRLNKGHAPSGLTLVKMFGCFYADARGIKVA